VAAPFKPGSDGSQRLQRHSKVKQVVSMTNHLTPLTDATLCCVPAGEVQAQHDDEADRVKHCQHNLGWLVLNQVQLERVAPCCESAEEQDSPNLRPGTRASKQYVCMFISEPWRSQQVVR
jgi:hypothetical protein